MNSDLASLAGNVLAKARQIKTVQQLQLKENQYAQRSARLEEQRERLRDGLDWLRAAFELHVTASDESANAKLLNARDRVTSMREAFGKDRSAILEDATFRLLLISLDGLAESLEQSVVSSWALYTAQALPPPLAGDEHLLRSDPRNSSEVIDRLVLWDELLRTLANNPRPSVAELTEFVTVLGSRRDLWEDLKIEEKADVVEFIRASGGGGAPLGLLTTSVKDWLVERGLLESYVIKKKD